MGKSNIQLLLAKDDLVVWKGHDVYYYSKNIVPNRNLTNLRNLLMKELRLG